MPPGKQRFKQPVGKSLFHAARKYSTLIKERQEWGRREQKRQLKANGSIGDKLPWDWVWAYKGQQGEVLAFNKSEARAKLKKLLGLKSLPRDILIQRVALDESFT